MMTDGADDNAILALLRAAHVPWHLSRQELVDRYGIRRHPAYHWDVIEIATPEPLLQGLLWPLSVQVFPQMSPFLPPTYFSSVTSFGAHSRDNIRLTARQLEPHLGTARIAGRHNTVHCQWTFGAASVALTVWPVDMQDGTHGSNDAHERDPRLVTGCHIAFVTGFRPSVTDQERAWLNTFVPIGPVAFGHAAASDYELEYLRTPFAGLEAISGQVGHSADRSALIVCHGQLYVIPLVDVIGFRVERLLPAKGSGGSWLQVECETHFASLARKTLTISTARGADDLNALAEKLATATGKPLELCAYDYDA